MFFWQREVDLWVVLVIVRGEKRWSDFLNATQLRLWHQARCSRRHPTPHVGIGCDPVRVIVLDLPCQSVFRRLEKDVLDPMAFWVRNACTLAVEVSVSGGSTEKNCCPDCSRSGQQRAEQNRRFRTWYGTFKVRIRHRRQLPFAGPAYVSTVSMVSQGEDGD